MFQILVEEKCLKFTKENINKFNQENVGIASFRFIFSLKKIIKTF